MGGRRSEITHTRVMALGLPDSTLNFFESISRAKLNSLQKQEEAYESKNYKLAVK